MRDALRVRHGSVGRIGARRHAHRGESRRARGKGKPAGCEHHGHLFDVLEGSARWMSSRLPPSNLPVRGNDAMTLLRAHVLKAVLVPRAGGPSTVREYRWYGGVGAG